MRASPPPRNEIVAWEGDEGLRCVPGPPEAALRWPDGVSSLEAGRGEGLGIGFLTLCLL